MRIAFELEDLKKDKEKRREKIGDFFLSGTDLGFRRWYIYVGELFWLSGGDSFWAARIGEFLREEKHKGIGEESNCNQGCPGMLLVTLEIITRVRFLRVFSFQNIWRSVVWCGRKGPQIVLLILIAYLFASNLFMIFPTSLSPLKNHETWLYLIFFLLFLFILSPLPRFSTIHVLNHSSWFPGGCLQTFHMSGNLERIRIERTLCFIQRKSIQKLSFIPTRNWFWNWSIMVE